VVVLLGVLRRLSCARCETLIADTVVSSTYTPGAGNIW
jgi:hypothetical protein